MRYEPLDDAGTLAKLTDLEGREVLAELRVGNLQGAPFRLAATGVLLGGPSGQPGLTALRSEATTWRPSCSPPAAS